ncbi:27091_t:CDS:2, partial [Gigaspora margarita]
MGTLEIKNAKEIDYINEMNKLGHPDDLLDKVGNKEEYKKFECYKKLADIEGDICPTKKQMIEVEIKDNEYKMCIDYWSFSKARATKDLSSKTNKPGPSYENGTENKNEKTLEPDLCNQIRIGSEKDNP